jgi:hypothetical protein
MPNSDDLVTKALVRTAGQWRAGTKLALATRTGRNKRAEPGRSPDCQRSMAPTVAASGAGMGCAPKEYGPNKQNLARQ